VDKSVQGCINALIEVVRVVVTVVAAAGGIAAARHSGLLREHYDRVKIRAKAPLKWMG